MLRTGISVPLSGDSEFHVPSIAEFFPGGLLFIGTPFEMSRINLIMVLMTAVLVVFFGVAFAKPRFVPAKAQNAAELGLDFVRINIAEEIIGHDGHKFVGYLTTLFFMIFAFNITSIIPGLQIAATSTIAVPFMLAMLTYFVFNAAGMSANGVLGYLKANLFPPGLPVPIYFLVTPIEFVATFILRPITLTIRLLANMMAGHLLLVLFFSATHFMLFGLDGVLKIFGLASFAAGFVFTLFEVLVAFLQAYIFTMLTAVYISGAVSEEH